MAKSHHLRLPNNRQLSYATYGSEDGTPVLYFHGFPGSRVEAALIDEQAKAAGVRLISIDRPGYGQSTPLPGRSLLDWCEDIRAFADQLELDSFSILGVSGGGPYACACGWKLGERVRKIAIVAGMGDLQHDTARSAMHAIARRLLGAAARHPEGTRKYFGWFCRFGLKIFPPLILVALAPFRHRSDQLALQDKRLRKVFGRSFAVAFAQQGAGVVDDLLNYARPWGFDVREIAASIALWHGTCDRTVPVEFAREMGSALPHAELHVLEDEGHFSIVLKCMDEVLGWLAYGTRLARPS